MGLSSLLSILFGGGRNVVRETVETFRPNSEAADRRSAATQVAALDQMAAEFNQWRNRTWFDGLIDALNRLPRPMLAFGTIGLFVAAMTDPIWFAERMQGLVLVPDQLWTLLGIVVAFYFGARELAHFRQSGIERAAMDAAANVPVVLENIEKIRELRHDTPGAADTGQDASLQIAATQPDRNVAIEEWRQAHG